MPSQSHHQRNQQKQQANMMHFMWLCLCLCVCILMALGNGKQVFQQIAHWEIKGDTTLKGAVATANTINADVKGKLSIESLQDTTKQASTQTNVGGRVQVSFGTAWEASGNASQSKGSGSSQAVKEQSGLIAGEGGYHIKADTVDLKGGAIVSTNSSTNASKSDLSTNAITFQNIENKMDYKASSVSMAGGISGGSSNANGSSGNSIQQQNFGDAKGGNVTPGLPSQVKGYDQSTTYATLTEGNITIAGKSTTAKELGLNTDASKANQQIATAPNIKDVLKEQQAMSAAAGTVIATSKQVAGDIASNAAKTQAAQEKIINDKTSTPEQIAEAKKIKAEAAQTQTDWATGGKYNQALGVVTASTVDKTAGQGGAATANAVGAVMAKQIGDLADKNQWKEGSPEKVILHGLAGLVQAKLGGTSELSGLTAGATKEVLTPVMESFLKSQGYSYGSAEFNDMMKLGSSLIGATVGGLVGNGALDINSGANVALIAEQNNRKLHPNDYKLAKALASKGKFTEKEILDALRWSGITDGKKLLVEAGHKEAYAVGSDGRVLNITKNKGWVSSSEMAGVSLEAIKGDQLVLKEVLPTAPSAEIIAFIKVNTGDTNSPYVFLPTTTPKPSFTSSLPAVPAGLTRATVMVDGVAYFPLKAECPQGCFDSIAHGIDDPGTRAYEKALDDKLVRDGIMFGLGLLDSTKIGFGLGRSAAGVGVAKGTVGGAVTREVTEGAIIAKTATNDAIGTTGLINSTRTATSAEMDAALGGGVSKIDAASRGAVETDIKVIGRLPDTKVAQTWEGHDVLNIPDWTLAKNMEWIDSGIKNNQLFYMGSPIEGNLVQTTGRYVGQPTVTALELERLAKAGYVKIGDYYVPPTKVKNFVPPKN